MASALPFTVRAARTSRALPSLSPVAAVGWRSLGVRMQSGINDPTVVDRCTAALEAALEPTSVKVMGAYDDPNGSHITIECVSPKFEGKRSLARQQMVFKAIWAEMDGQGGTVHAVDTMVLKSPSEVKDE
ncbi:hypothetical protein EMIHUDRAFT_452727 [Emiliania huxleyi CCMP1516]|uniref:BolA-like protein n=2 Tax=Emiliania huxleyi TaxID=2903 RepID=A0A0D3IG68_EMIH1|nr:hypothetical protein EMIHUDRAFT_452727 [Emiliania huxleyi CCMP1516]EOD10253.1 hypothetical protein EMIHUDRAFT_452727 [Emiliania huxleyi CCMP1516]|eukprot:XP_005762682.1 hypothetical protein EMIHUDRAFT_452727 [Emiliania huxleyi CCMP1516]